MRDLSDTGARTDFADTSELPLAVRLEIPNTGSAGPRARDLEPRGQSWRHGPGQSSAERYRSPSRKILAASLAQLGRMDEAHEEARQFLAMDPRFSVRRWSDTQPFRDETMRQHFMDGYIKAGLPG